MISESTWLSTLFEVKRQGLLFLNKEESSDASSAGADEWVTIDREDAGDPEWSELWPQHQWQVAFEILVRHSYYSGTGQFEGAQSKAAQEQHHLLE